MNQFLRALLALSIACTTSTLSAAVHERDWLTPSDGLLTYDDVHRREWLDLSVSRLDQFAGDTLEDKYQAAALEVAPGGLFDGFTIAKSPDVLALAQSAGINTLTQDFEVNEGPTINLISLLGPTLSGPNRNWSAGMLDEPSSHPLHTRYSALVDFAPPAMFSSGSAGLAISDDFDDLLLLNAGVLLYRAVPEPNSALLLFCGIAILLTRAR